MSGVQSHQCVTGRDKDFLGRIFVKYGHCTLLIGLDVTRTDCWQMVDLYVQLYLAVSGTNPPRPPQVNPYYDLKCPRGITDF